MKLKLGGVPEHFNSMWQLPAARELMRHYGIIYDWQNFPGGTGAMAQSLLQGEIDMAIMLTEGAIASIAEGKPFKIWFPFVMSPLIWGIFTSAKRKTLLPATYKDGKFAISRFNSGSHLMAQFLAQRENSELNAENFVVSQDLEGARLKLLSEEADYFLWEKYMTQPLVYKKEFIQLGEVSAPWPSFVFVSMHNLNLPEPEVWKEAVYQLTSEFLQDNKSEIVGTISQQFDLKPKDVETWLKDVKYYDNNDYWQDRLTAAVIIMHSKGMIKAQPNLNQLLGLNSPNL